MCYVFNTEKHLGNIFSLDGMAIHKCNGDVCVAACKLLKIQFRQETNVSNDHFPHWNTLQRQWAGERCLTGYTLASCSHIWNNLTTLINIHKWRNYSHIGDDLTLFFTNISPLFTCLSLSSISFFFFFEQEVQKRRDSGVWLFMYLFSVTSTSAPAAKQLLGGLLLPLGFADVPDE